MVLEIFFAAGCFWGVEKNFENIAERFVDQALVFLGKSISVCEYSVEISNSAYIPVRN